MTPWSHGIALMPLYDRLFLQEQDKSREPTWKPFFKCSSCKREPSFYGNWFYFTSRNVESDKQTHVVKRLCPVHAASLAAKHGISIGGHLAMSDIGPLEWGKAGTVENVLDRYESETGIRLPVVEGHRLSPTLINAMWAISMDPKRAIVLIKPRVWVLSSDEDASEAQRAPLYLFSYQLMRPMVDLKWIARGPEVKTSWGTLLPSKEFVITETGEEIVALIKSKAGGPVP